MNLDPRLCSWRPHDTLDRKCRRNLAGGLSWRCERAGELRSDTSRTGAHRLLPWPKSVLSWTIGSCRCQSARNQTPRGIGRLLEQTLPNTNHVSDDKVQTIPARAGRLGVTHSRAATPRRAFTRQAPSECGQTEPNGAQGRDRTTDTAIFSRMLYQLSYLGMSRRGAGSAGL